MNKLALLIAKQDEVLTKKNPHCKNELAKTFDNLTTFGQVEVGWRESCGSTDKTVFIKRGWDKVIAAAKKDGMIITEERIKHNNQWASKCGGFWSSIIYRTGSQS